MSSIVSDVLNEVDGVLQQEVDYLLETELAIDNRDTKVNIEVLDTWKPQPKGWTPTTLDRKPDMLSDTSRASNVTGSAYSSFSSVASEHVAEVQTRKPAAMNFDDWSQASSIVESQQAEGEVGSLAASVQTGSHVGSLVGSRHSQYEDDFEVESGSEG